MSEATVSPAAMRIVKLLVGKPPLTVAQMMDGAGVTRTAITEQLNELVAGGFVDRTIEKLTGRGRPRHRYSATTAALLLLFASNQRLVVPAIWKAIDEIGGHDLIGQVLRRVTGQMVEHYRPLVSGQTPRDRLRHLTQLLTDEGHLVELVEDGHGVLTMHKRSCPFISMFEEMRTVCDVDLEVMSAVVGARVVRTSCRHDGAPCCTFELAAPGG
jgi:DeoR family transcriptional regulator, suf operon transcriptional repressor